MNPIKISLLAAVIVFVLPPIYIIIHKIVRWKYLERFARQINCKYFYHEEKQFLTEGQRRYNIIRGEYKGKKVEIYDYSQYVAGGKGTATRYKTCITYGDRKECFGPNFMLPLPWTVKKKFFKLTNK